MPLKIARVHMKCKKYHHLRFSLSFHPAHHGRDGKAKGLVIRGYCRGIGHPRLMPKSPASAKAQRRSYVGRPKAWAMRNSTIDNLST